MNIRPREWLAILCGVLFWSLCIGTGFAQDTKPQAQHPEHLPYSFSNFVWWTDEELRDLLKKRIPGLGSGAAVRKALGFDG
jgi:hypothetical protein